MWLGLKIMTLCFIQVMVQFPHLHLHFYRFMSVDWSGVLGYLLTKQSRFKTHSVASDRVTWSLTDRVCPVVDFWAISRLLCKTELIDGSRTPTERTLCWNCVPAAVCKVNNEHPTSTFKPTRARRVPKNWKFNIHISRSADEAQGDGMESSRNGAKCTFISLQIVLVRFKSPSRPLKQQLRKQYHLDWDCWSVK